MLFWPQRALQRQALYRSLWLPIISFLFLWLLWIGSLAATGVAYGGPMVGAFALPASIPSVSDLLLPLLVGVTEFLLFTILVHQVSPVGLNNMVNTWLIIMTAFAFVAELSVFRAWHYYAAGLRERIYSDDVAGIMTRYLQCIARDARGLPLAQS